MDIDIKKIITAAQTAQKSIEQKDQSYLDDLARAVAAAIYEPKNARKLAEIAVEDTGLGNVEDKILKNQRKTLGTLNDLMSFKSTGLISSDSQTGLSVYHKPIGVVGALTPSTNPAATPANHAMMALKCANSIVISPSPAGHRTAVVLKEMIDANLHIIGADKNLVQILPKPVTLSRAEQLMSDVDLLLVTGDQANVRKGYSSGTPCIGVGKGNVPVIIDSCADLSVAADLIKQSKIFDNSTSCSSENSLVILDSAYDEMMTKLNSVGGYILDKRQVQAVEQIMFPQGKINRKIIGRSFKVLADLFGINDVTTQHKFFIAPQDEVGLDFKLSGEKLSLVLSVYRVSSIDAAIQKVNEILDYEGLGHSVGIHTRSEVHAKMVAENVKVVRTLVNQAHTFGNGGGFNNSLPFSLSMGCGSWGKNSIADNLSVSHFVNKTYLVEPIENKSCDEHNLFGRFKNW